jgi:hypothetical protein
MTEVQFNIFVVSELCLFVCIFFKIFLLVLSKNQCIYNSSKLGKLLLPRLNNFSFGFYCFNNYFLTSELLELFDKCLNQFFSMFFRYFKLIPNRLRNCIETLKNTSEFFDTFGALG